MTKQNLPDHIIPVGGYSWPPTLVYRAWKFWTVRLAIIFFTGIFIFGLGWISSTTIGSKHHPHTTPSDESMVKNDDHIQNWTCSMHPQIKLTNPGQCPICFMDLIPISNQEDDSGPTTTFSWRELTRF